MAQLGARFHGMEEVVSSNLTRSTKFNLIKDTDRHVCFHDAGEVTGVRTLAPFSRGMMDWSPTLIIISYAERRIGTKRISTR